MCTTARMAVEATRGRYEAVQIDDREREASTCCIKLTQSFDDLLGLEVLGRLRQNADAVVLLTCRFIRMYAFGYLAVVLVVYLTSIGFTTATSGSVFTWTLIGDAVVSLYLTTNADKIGRRKTLIYSAVLASATAIIFATQNNYWLILITATIGVISPSGNEIGPFMAIEQSSLKQIIIAKDSVRAQAWYNFVGSMATALGSLSCGISIDVFQTWGLTTTQSYQGVMIIYAFLQFFLISGFHFLGPRIELPEKIAVLTGVPCGTPVEVEEPAFLGLRKSKMIVVQLSLLFMIDSFAGAFVLQSLCSDWFVQAFSASATTIGEVLFCCNIVAGVSSLFAGKLSEVIGLVMTMVVTHLPSNVLLILVPLMPNAGMSMLMLILRFSISQMDVPTRNAYVMGVVDEDERSAANGVTNIVRSVGASVGPTLAGFLLLYPSTQDDIFYIAGGLKIVYDFLLLLSFRTKKSKDEIEFELNMAQGLNRTNYSAGGFQEPIKGETSSSTTRLV